MKIWTLLLIITSIVILVALTVTLLNRKKPVNSLSIQESITTIKEEMTKTTGDFHQCNGVVVPHAAFKYCGVLTALGFNSIDNSNVVFLWFKHKKTELDHSYTNPHDIISKMGGNIVKSICVTSENWESVAKQLSPNDKLIVSSDFTHIHDWSYDKIVDNDIGIIDALIHNPFVEISTPQPCGIYPLRTFMLWAQHNNMNVYPSAYHQSCMDPLGVKTEEGMWNRFKHKKEGYKVSYCVVGAYPKNTQPFQCKLVALTHIDWMLRKINTNIRSISWSALLKKKGSVFITVKHRGRTHCCYGGWENNSNNLSNAIDDATNSIYSRSWNGNTPIKNMPNNFLDRCSITITWISPKKTWRITHKPIIGKGHVIYNKSNHPVTFIPSVWDTTSIDKFYDFLSEKAGVSGRDLWVYDSFVWNYNL